MKNYGVKKLSQLYLINILRNKLNLIIEIINNYYNIIVRILV